MMNLVLAFLVACGGPTAASIKFDGEQAPVHTVDAVAVKAPQVLDAEGKALAEQPAVVWTVTPDSVAKLDGNNIVPVANGEAVITAAVGEIKAEYKLLVQLPDNVAIAGYDPAAPFAVGETRQMTAAVRSGETAIDGLKATWSVTAPAVATIDENGLLTAVAAGMTDVKATYAGAAPIEATTSITVVDAAPAAADAAAPK